jgi:hypothetical protein
MLANDNQTNITLNVLSRESFLFFALAISLVSIKRKQRKQQQHCFSISIQVHSCRSEDALAQKRCEIKAEGRGDGNKKKLAEKKSLKTERIWPQ